MSSCNGSGRGHRFPGPEASAEPFARLHRLTLYAHPPRHRRKAQARTQITAQVTWQLFAEATALTPWMI